MQGLCKKKHEINNKYTISVPTNCLKCKLGCQATADFMGKLKEHNPNRACLLVGPLACVVQEKKRLLSAGVCMFSECDVDLFGTSG